MIINKVLAICLSPDRGGLELYFLKFIEYYRGMGLHLHVGCSKISYISDNTTGYKIEIFRKGFFQKIKNIFLLRRYIIDNNLTHLEFVLLLLQDQIHVFPELFQKLSQGLERVLYIAFSGRGKWVR